MIAALFVERDGVYAGLPDVDVWDEARDARLYAGPWPVVAHPPCAKWCQLAPVNKARYGLQIGADGGCFEAALASVRYPARVPGCAARHGAHGCGRAGGRDPVTGSSRAAFGYCTCSHAIYDHARAKFSGNVDHSYVACGAAGCLCAAYTASDGSQWPNGPAGAAAQAPPAAPATP